MTAAHYWLERELEVEIFDSLNAEHVEELLSGIQSAEAAYGKKIDEISNPVPINVFVFLRRFRHPLVDEEDIVVRDCCFWGMTLSGRALEDPIKTAW
jgi:hypothetical protein